MLISKKFNGNRRVVNLRPDSEGNLRPVGRPLLLPAPGRKPIGALTLASHRYLVCAEGTELHLHRADSATAVPVIVGGALPAEPDCAIALSDTRLLVMTAAGSAEVRVEGNLVNIVSTKAFEGISLTTVKATTISAMSERYTLPEPEMDYSRRILKYGHEILAMGKALYADIHSTAATNGAYIQQVVCGFRLFNPQGREIFRSAPYLLGLPAADSTISLYSDDGNTIKQYELRLDPWRPHLKVKADATLNEMVGRLEVVALPQIHLCEPSHGGSVHPTRRTGSNEPFARLLLSSDNVESAYHAARIEGLAARLFANGTVIASFVNPFATGIDLDIQAQANPIHADDCAALKKVRAGATDGCKDSLNAMFALPHGFTARNVARSGNVILWGNVNANRYAGYPPEMLVAAVGSDTSESWTFKIKTRFRDGSETVCSGTRTGGRPVALHPLISYPSVDAVSITVFFSWGSAPSLSRWSHEFRLQPSAAGGFAFYLSNDRTPMEISATGALPITEIPAWEARSCPDMVIAAHADAPLVPVVCVGIPDGAVTAIVERGGNDTAWDNMRSRFFIGSRGGVHALGVNLTSSRPTCSLRRLCSAGIEGPGGLTALGEGAAALLCSSAATQPVLIGKNGLVKNLCELFEATNLLYNPIKNELMVAHKDGVRVFCGDHDFQWFERTDLSFLQVFNIDGLPFALNASGILAMGMEQLFSGTMEVALEADIQFGAERMVRPRRVRASLSGDDLLLTVALRRIEPDGMEKEQVAQTNLSGQVRRPLRFGVFCRPLHACRWSIEGEVNHTFIFKSINIDTNEHRTD